MKKKGQRPRKRRGWIYMKALELRESLEAAMWLKCGCEVKIADVGSDLFVEVETFFGGTREELKKFTWNLCSWLIEDCKEVL